MWSPCPAEIVTKKGGVCFQTTPPMDVQDRSMGGLVQAGHVQHYDRTVSEMARMRVDFDGHPDTKEAQEIVC